MHLSFAFNLLWNLDKVVRAKKAIAWLKHVKEEHNLTVIRLIDIVLIEQYWPTQPINSNESNEKKERKKEISRDLWLYVCMHVYIVYVPDCMYVCMYVWGGSGLCNSHV